ncbi:MAG: DUF3493 domain-containing protein [Cyanobacteria bacterium P01_F01_bin.42]
MNPKNLTPEQRSRLEAEVKSPFKSLRRFFYIAFALSGGIGAYIFLIKLLSGDPWRTTLPNLVIQLGLTALMGGLFWIERDR